MNKLFLDNYFFYTGRLSEKRRIALLHFEETFSKEKNMEMFRKIYESGKV